MVKYDLVWIIDSKAPTLLFINMSNELKLLEVGTIYCIIICSS